MRIDIPLVGESYKFKDLPNLDAQECINMYYMMDSTGKFPQAVLPFPGLKLFSAGIEGEKSVRILYRLNNRYFGVIDNQFIEFTSNGERLSTIGTLGTIEGRMSIIANENQLCLRDTLSTYIYQLVDQNGRKKGDFYQRTYSSATISKPVFSGQGSVNDLTASGTYTGNANTEYQVIITDETVPGIHNDKFKWSSDAGTTFTGNVEIGSTAAILLNNGISITFANTTGHKKDNKWIFNIDVDSAIYVPSLPSVHDTYGVFPRSGTTIFDLTKPNDFSTIDATDFAYVNGENDNVVGSLTVRDESWLFCEQSTYIWYDTGAADFPFEPRKSLKMFFGCQAPYSIVLTDKNQILWLGKNANGERVVIHAQGYEPIIISNEAMNSELKDYDTVEDAFAFSYQWEGHVFYLITFPTEDKSWEYDLMTKKWHQRTSTLINQKPSFFDKRQGRYRANCFLNWDGNLIVGDFESGNLYQMDRDTYTEYPNNYILRQLTFPHIQKELRRLFLHRIILDCKPGVGIGDGVVSINQSDPVIRLQISKDAGNYFFPERSTPLGKIGNNLYRSIWKRLGMSRIFTLKLKMTDPVYFAILGCVVELDIS